MYSINYDPLSQTVTEKGIYVYVSNYNSHYLLGKDNHCSSEYDKLWFFLKEYAYRKKPKEKEGFTIIEVQVSYPLNVAPTKIREKLKQKKGNNTQ